MQRLNFTTQCMATYKSHIDVPDGMTLQQAIEYAKNNLDKAPIESSFTYVPDSDEIDEESCTLSPVPKGDDLPCKAT